MGRVDSAAKTLGNVMVVSVMGTTALAKELWKLENREGRRGHLPRLTDRIGFPST